MARSPEHRAGKWQRTGRLLAMLAVAAVTLPVFAADWPSPELADGMEATAVASHMIYNGTDMRSLVFTSGQAPDDVIGFYRKAWGKRAVANRYSGWQVIGRRQGDFYITVQVRATGQGSRGDIGIVRIPSGGTEIELGAGVPRPGNTVVVNDIAYPDDDTPARTLAMANNLSAAQNASYYRAHLVADGWSPVGGGDCAHGASQCVANYERGAQKMLLALSENAGRSEIVINLMGEGVTP